METYSKELLAGKIVDEIREQENMVGNIGFVVEFESCVAELKLFYDTSRGVSDVLELDDVEIYQCVLFFEDSETDFNTDEIKEIEKLVKLYF